MIRADFGDKSDKHPSPDVLLAGSIEKHTVEIELQDQALERKSPPRSD